MPTTPLRASDPKPPYTGVRNLKDIAIKPGSLRMSGDGFFITLQGVQH
jgi:hypothetical protein